MSQIKCKSCHKNEANYHKIYGYLPCDNCTNKRRANNLPTQPVEMIGEQMKRERKEFGKSTVQPFSSDGTFSREYLEANGKKGVKVTDDQVKKAKYVWGGAYSRNYDIAKAK